MPAGIEAKNSDSGKDVTTYFPNLLGYIKDERLDKTNQSGNHWSKNPTITNHKRR